MPYRRKREVIDAIDATAALHLAIGDCLLAGRGSACGCGLRLSNGEFRMQEARRYWRAHRAEVLAQCRPGERPWIETQLPARGA